MRVHRVCGSSTGSELIREPAEPDRDAFRSVEDEVGPLDESELLVRSRTDEKAIDPVGAHPLDRVECRQIAQIVSGEDDMTDGELPDQLIEDASFVPSPGPQLDDLATQFDDQAEVCGQH